MQRPLRYAAAAILATAALSMSACSRTLVEEPIATDYDRRDIVRSVDFWHELPRRSAVTNDEALHGLILFADGDDPNETYDQRAEYLKALGWLAGGFDEPANLAMQRGTLAKALTHALEIEGGVMMQLTGKSARYATRELVFLGIMPPGTEQQVLSGYQYVGVISEAQDYQLLREGANVREVPPPADQLDAPDDATNADEPPADGGG